MTAIRKLMSLASVSLLLSGKPAGVDREIGAPLSKREAHELALSTLAPRARRFSGIQFDTVFADAPQGFYVFEIVANTPPGTSFNLGFFAVNHRTGDVWDWSACIRRSSPRITEVQQRLRRKSGLSASAFRALSDLAPCQP
jgi:hypothetical protein